MLSYRQCLTSSHPYCSFGLYPSSGLGSWLQYRDWDPAANLHSNFVWYLNAPLCFWQPLAITSPKTQSLHHHRSLSPVFPPVPSTSCETSLRTMIYLYDFKWLISTFPTAWYEYYHLLDLPDASCFLKHHFMDWPFHHVSVMFLHKQIYPDV